MPALLGPLAAFGASAAWAYATSRYALVAEEVGSVRVNLARSAFALPVYATATALSGAGLRAVTPSQALWLLGSVVSSYALGDSVFLTAARKIGITTALSIASIYPLWAATWGVLVAHEQVGPWRATGMGLAIAGVVWLVRLGAAEPAGARARGGAGLALALFASLLWAGNSVSVKEGAVGLGLAQVNTLRYGLALALLAPQVRIGSGRKLPASPRGGWRPVLPALAVDSILGSSCYVYGLSHTDLAVGATLSSLAPLIAVPLAVATGVERWSARRFAAVLATVGGVILLVASGGG